MRRRRVAAAAGGEVILIDVVLVGGEDEGVDMRAGGGRAGRAGGSNGRFVVVIGDLVYGGRAVFYRDCMQILDTSA